MVWVILAIILTHQIVLYRRRRHFDALSLETLVDLVLLFLFVIGPMLVESVGQRINGEWEFAFAIILGILALYAGMHAPPLGRPKTGLQKIRRSGVPGFRGSGVPGFRGSGLPGFRDSGKPKSQAPSPEAPSPKPLDTGWLWLVFALFILIALVITASNMAGSGANFWAYFAGGRLSNYGRTILEGGGAFLYLFMAAARPAALILLAIALYRRRWGQAALIYAVLLFAILAVFRTRAEVLITLSLPVAYYHYRVRRLPGWVFAGGIVGFLFSMVLLNVWRGFGLATLTETKISAEQVLLALGQSFNVLRGFEWLWDYHSAGQLNYEYGLNYFYTLLAPIPRALWPGKPITSFANRWTIELQGDVVDPFGSIYVWTFTAWGEGLAQFGLMGIFLNLFFYGYVIRCAKNLVQGKEFLFLVWYYYSIIAALSLRAGFDSFFVQMGFGIGPALFFYWLAQRRLVLRARHLVPIEKVMRET